MPLDLAAIKTRLAAITPWPWKRRGLGIWTMAGCKIAAIVGAPHLPQGIEGPGRTANAIFFEHAPADVDALVAEVEQLRAAIRETYTAPDPAAFFAAERALHGLVSDNPPTSLPAQIEACGWLWEAGCVEHRDERGRYCARLWLPNLDPLHYDEPADERWGYGATAEAAMRVAFEALPPKVSER